MIKIELKDGSIKEIESGKSIFEIAKSISEGLARVATAGKSKWRSKRFKNNNK